MKKLIKGGSGVGDEGGFAPSLSKDEEDAIVALMGLGFGGIGSSDVSEEDIKKTEEMPAIQNLWQGYNKNKKSRAFPVGKYENKSIF